MAEVNGIASVGASSGAAGALYSTPRVKSADTVKQPDAAQDKKASEAGKKAEEKQLENVISTSQDGDTVQAGKEALDKLKEDEEYGRVVDKGSLLAAKDPSAERRAELREEAEKKAEEKEEEKEEEKNVTSFNGYTDAQLKQMYLKGDISRQDYDKEIEDRESKKEARGEEEEKFMKEGAQNVGKQKENERDADTIKNIGSEDSSDAPDAMMRAQIMQALDANSVFESET